MADVHDPRAWLNPQNDALHGRREVTGKAKIGGQRDDRLAHGCYNKYNILGWRSSLSP
jgi:hypothetical protein